MGYGDPRRPTWTPSRMSCAGLPVSPTDLPEIVEMDLNPVLAGPEGCRALDCKIRVKSPQVTEPLLRRRRLG